MYVATIVHLDCMITHKTRSHSKRRTPLSPGDMPESNGWESPEERVRGLAKARNNLHQGMLEAVFIAAMKPGLYHYTEKDGVLIFYKIARRFPLSHFRFSLNMFRSCRFGA